MSRRWELNSLPFSLSNIKLHTPRYSLQISSALAVEKTNMNQIQGIGVEERVEWDVIDFCSGCVCRGIDTRHNSEIPVTLLSSSIISQQQRDGGGGKEGSVWALCPGSCFLNSRLIFHTCAVLGDISSYTRQARVHRFLDSFPKREKEERNG